MYCQYWPVASPLVSPPNGEGGSNPLNTGGKIHPGSGVPPGMVTHHLRGKVGACGAQPQWKYTEGAEEESQAVIKG